MSRIVILAENYCSRHPRGLWTAGRTEARVVFDLAAVLGVAGHGVTVVSNDLRDAPGVPFRGVQFARAPVYGDVDYVVFATTSPVPRHDLRALVPGMKRSVRIQWPGSFSGVDLGANIVACAEPALLARAREYLGAGVVSLPRPTLSLSWLTQNVVGLAVPGIEEERRGIAWAIRDFGDRNAEDDYFQQWKSRLLTLTLDCASQHGLTVDVLSGEFYKPDFRLIDKHQVLQRLARAGARVGDCCTPLDGLLATMRRSKVVVTNGTGSPGTPLMMHAAFEGCAPIVWTMFDSMYPDLIEVARKYDVLMHYQVIDEQPDRIATVLRRLVEDEGMRREYVRDCCTALAAYSPENTLAAWRAIEAS